MRLSRMAASVMRQAASIAGATVGQVCGAHYGCSAAFHCGRYPILTFHAQSQAKPMRLAAVAPSSWRRPSVRHSSSLLSRDAWQLARMQGAALRPLARHMAAAAATEAPVKEETYQYQAEVCGWQPAASKHAWLDAGCHALTCRLCAQHASYDAGRMHLFSQQRQQRPWRSWQRMLVAYDAAPRPLTDTNPLCRWTASWT